ncbi:MAG: hypothetical protein HKN98_02690 [Silicimonas sp.]|nr:hypothetical protein [Silicimonas sp.]
MLKTSEKNQENFSIFARFRREDGAVTVDAVIWIPFFVICLTLLADAALIFYGQARALKVAQDANRALSVGSLASYDATEDYIENALVGMSPNASATTGSDDGVITTIVTLPANDLAAIGFFTSMTTFDMQVVAQMVKEF